MLRLPSCEDGAVLELDAHNSDYFRATLRHRGLVAESLVGSYQSFGLPEFLGEMARDWRGWAGERQWTSFETELTLRATADRTGHIALEVRLQGGTYPKWYAQATLILEAGQLEQLALTASRFESSAIHAS